MDVLCSCLEIGGLECCFIALDLMVLAQVTSRKMCGLLILPFYLPYFFVHSVIFWEVIIVRKPDRWLSVNFVCLPFSLAFRASTHCIIGDSRL